MARNDFSIKSVKPTVQIGKNQMGESTDSRGIVRPAIFLDKSPGGSFDVFAKDGTHLCQINIFDFKDGKGNVDVILFGEKKASLIAFRNPNGERNEEEPTFETLKSMRDPWVSRIDATLPGAQTFAVNISGGTGAKVE